MQARLTHRIENVEMSDYLKEGDVGFKKPKKRKKHTNRRVVESDLAAEQPISQEDGKMQLDEAPPAPLKNLDTNFVDDDELQAALSRARKAKMKKVQKQSPEEIAMRSEPSSPLRSVINCLSVAEEKAAEEAAADLAMKTEEEVGLVLDDTTEFVQSISLEEKKPEKRVVVINNIKKEDDEDAMDEDDIDGEELEAGELDDEREEELKALKMELDKQFGDGADLKVDEVEVCLLARASLNDQRNVQVGTAAEKTHSTGLAGTLSILRAQGALQESSTEQRERERIQKQRDHWLAEQRTRDALRELERAKARGVNKDQQQREYENRLREQREAREAMKSFENYTPDVNIAYYDEFGRAMTPKEAWKALSHRFHGKGSGKAKMEKRLKKIAEEKKMLAMQAGETPLGMASAFQARAEKLGQAHMVLSVGNRGYISFISSRWRC